MPDYGAGAGAAGGTCGASCSGGACDLGGGAGYGRGRPRQRGWLGGINYAGWIDQGVTINTSSPSNGSNFPVTFNDESNEYLLDQVYMLLERPVEQLGYAWDIGGRVDLLFGTDAKFTTARGLETHHDFSDRWNFDRYGLAMPQLYMEVNAPFGDGLSLKLGHFYTLLGYEKVPAVENFFYSHSYALQYGEPLTHTGFLGSVQCGNVSYHAGMTRGWNNWEDNNNDFGVLGAVKWTSDDQRTSLSYAVHTGPEQDEPPTNAQLPRRVEPGAAASYRLADALRHPVRRWIRAGRRRPGPLQCQLVRHQPVPVLCDQLRLGVRDPFRVVPRCRRHAGHDRTGRRLFRTDVRPELAAERSDRGAARIPLGLGRYAGLPSVRRRHQAEPDPGGLRRGRKLLSSGGRRFQVVDPVGWDEVPPYAATRFKPTGSA